MFGFNVGRRRRKAAARGPSRVRRLSVETMERRLMLATNAADFGAEDFITARYSLTSAGVQAIAIQSFESGAFTDGGFLTHFAPPGVSPTTGHTFVLSDSVLADRAFAGGVNPTRLNSTAQTPVDFDSDTLPTPGIPILVISPTANDTSDFSNSPSPPVTSSPEHLGDGEGGAIAIQSIIASIGPGATPAVGQSVIGKTSPGQNDAKRAASIVAVSFDSSPISGEWARPAMMELAGGEPGATGRQSASNRPSDEQSGQSPLSFDHNLQASRLHLVRYRATNDRDADEIAVSPADETRVNDLPNASFRKDDAVLDGARPWDLSSREKSYSPTSPEAQVEPGSDAFINREEKHLAQAEFFERLGADEVAAAPLIERAPTWDTPLKATSLLMILALERVATGNSRRGKGHAVVQTQKVAT